MNKILSAINAALRSYTLFDTHINPKLNIAKRSRPLPKTAAALFLAAFTVSANAATFACSKTDQPEPGETVARGSRTMHFEASTLAEAREKAMVQFNGRLRGCYITITEEERNRALAERDAQRRVKEQEAQNKIEADWRARVEQESADKQAQAAASKNRATYGDPLKSFAFGEYLDAIYIGNIEEIRRIDQQYIGAGRAQFEQLRMSSPIWEKLLSPIDLSRATLVVPVARAYLKKYGATYRQCLEKDAPEYSVRTTTSNGYGVVQAQSDTVYRVNRKFGEIFRKMMQGSSQDGTSEFADLVYGSPLARLELGIEQMMSQYRCSDPIIGRFETGLLDMYSRLAER